MTTHPPIWAPPHGGRLLHAWTPHPTIRGGWVTLCGGVKPGTNPIPTTTGTRCARCQEVAAAPGITPQTFEIGGLLAKVRTASRAVQRTETRLVDQRATRNNAIRAALAGGAGIRQVARSANLTPRAVTLIGAELPPHWEGPIE